MANSNDNVLFSYACLHGMDNVSKLKKNWMQPQQQLHLGDLIGHDFLLGFACPYQNYNKHINQRIEIIYSLKSDRKYRLQDLQET
jgi:hypothetical protein